MVNRLTKLRLEPLEERRVMSAAPLLDLNGVGPGADFFAERVDQNGLVEIVSHDLMLADSDSGQLSGATITNLNHKPGDVIGVKKYGTNIYGKYENGVLELRGDDSVAVYQQVLRTARFNSSATRSVGEQVDISFTVSDGENTSTAAHSRVSVIAAGTATVVGRHLFYNHSAFDGDNPAADANDDLAIATDKQALPQSQTATFANYSNYHRGINGIMIDIAGPHGAISANDFLFEAGNNNEPDTWHEVPPPTAVFTRPGAGVGGADRVTITWEDGAIVNEWLQVVVAANSHTGLAKPDTFLFGNSTGDTGNSTVTARVTPKDVVRVIIRLLVDGATPAAINDPLDFTRDGQISPRDAQVAINHIVAQGEWEQVFLVNVPAIPKEHINSTTSSITFISGVPDFVWYPPPQINGVSAEWDSHIMEASGISVLFPYLLSTVGGSSGEHSAINSANYELLKAGVTQPGAIVNAAVRVTVEKWEDAKPAARSYIDLTFDRPLTPGYYTIKASSAIHTGYMVPIPGNSGGDEYSYGFTIWEPEP